MENVKYILIISQYYYSHHCFAVSADEEDFREKALTLIEMLEDYKRSENNQREYKYGYPRDEAYTDISVRWNVNDAGDIYFIPCRSISEVLGQAAEYNTDYMLATRYKGMPKKQREKIETEIYKHHNFDKIENIVLNNFEII